MRYQTELGESISELDMGIGTRGRASRHPLSHFVLETFDGGLD
jgi:hypothetical protein